MLAVCSVNTVRDRVEPEVLLRFLTTVQVHAHQLAVAPGNTLHLAHSRYLTIAVQNGPERSAVWILVPRLSSSVALCRCLGFSVPPQVVMWKVSVADCHMVVLTSRVLVSLQCGEPVCKTGTYHGAECPALFFFFSFFNIYFETVLLSCPGWP